MENAEALKEAVREKYGQLARAGEGSCCGPTNCCGTGSGDGFVNFSEDYTNLEGYDPKPIWGWVAVFPWRLRTFSRDNPFWTWGQGQAMMFSWPHALSGTPVA